MEKTIVIRKIEMVKLVGGLIVSAGVGMIIDNAIKATTPVRTGTIRKICMALGALVISSMVGDKAVEYTEEKIDSAVAGFKKMIDEDKDEKQEEKQEETLD
jgi:hypothetical protein